VTLQAKLDAFRAQLLNKQTAAEFGVSENYFPDPSQKDYAQEASLADLVSADGFELRRLVMVSRASRALHGGE
jgi:hypothetical protein